MSKFFVNNDYGVGSKPKFRLRQKVKQVATTDDNYRHLMVNRVGLVVEIFIDENGKSHYLTDDDFWCPEELLIAVD